MPYVIISDIAFSIQDHRLLLPEGHRNQIAKSKVSFVDNF